MADSQFFFVDWGRVCKHTPVQAIQANHPLENTAGTWERLQNGNESVIILGENGLAGRSEEEVMEGGGE